MRARHFKYLAPILCLLFFAAQSPAREAGWVPMDSPQEIARQRGAGKRPLPPKESKTRKKGNPAEEKTVYDNQPPVTEREINAFVAILPSFRAWARQNGENAHPTLNSNGKPDFLYSVNAAKWVREHEFDPPRFFCIMGRMAAGMVIVEEGNDFKGTRPVDMPSVDKDELGLVRKHMKSLLRAGGPAQPIK